MRDTCQQKSPKPLSRRHLINNPSRETIAKDLAIGDASSSSLPNTR